VTTVQPRWRKSSRSANTTDCVELHRTLGAIRDSKRPDGPALAVRALPTFITQVKAGQFCH
jgi:Domain of unknown function (DUF397)